MDKTEQQQEYQRDEHRVHLILYHVICCPRRRKPILIGKVKERCQQLIELKCKQKGWTILPLAIQPDHLHVFVRVLPGNSAAEVVKELKGITSFHLRRECIEITKKVPSLWTRSYFANTAGHVNRETIQRYIDAQKGI